MKKADTGMVARIGDWIGEKTGAYETGKSSYERVASSAAQEAAQVLAEMERDFVGKNLSESELAQLRTVSERLAKASGSKLKDVGWADAVLHTTGGKDIDVYRYAVRTTVGAAEGAYEGVAGIAEISMRAIATLATVPNPKVRAVVAEDLRTILSSLTLENAEKLLKALPAALEEFKKLPGDEQMEGAMKLVG